MPKVYSCQRILIIICQANGDVLLSSPLIHSLHQAYPEATIDLMVNASTLSMAQNLEHVSNIEVYDYAWRKKGLWYRLKKEFELFKKLWKKYDLAICLTASDRNVLLAITSGKVSIAEVDKESQKSWWKVRGLDHIYRHDPKLHIVLNNKKVLDFLGIAPAQLIVQSKVDPMLRKTMEDRLAQLGIGEFIVFHPSARGGYKIYPVALRNQLLTLLSQANVTVIVTGGKSPLDEEISAGLPVLPHLYNFIGQCESIAELVALMDLSKAYVGMDTLNMHLAASLNKPIFAIFGPTNPLMWSPWSNELQRGGSLGPARLQCYGNVHLFQAMLPCVPCFKAGCEDKGGKSECLTHISPEFIAQTVLNGLSADEIKRYGSDYREV